MRNQKAFKIYIGIVGVIVLLNLLGWSSRGFCDAYICYVFPIWINTYGRLMGCFPFSVGEWLLVLGIMLLATAVLGLIINTVWWIVKKKLVRWVCVYLKIFAWIVLFVGLIMTLNCSLLYHASTFDERYLGNSENAEYSMREFIEMRNHLVTRCNELSAEMARDAEGYIAYPGDERNLQDKSRVTMQELGKEFPQLSGFYPRPKAMFFSDFMCQQDMLGWYFPFSMEANYNKVAYFPNKPTSLCHELAHLKGFIYEDEANFIGYLACVRSEDPYFEYSGYLSVFGYVEQDLRQMASKDPDGLQAACEGIGLVKPLDVVYADCIFLTPKERERIEGKALLDSETVSRATDTFIDTTLKVNGVSDGMISYSRVVKLMMLYEKYQKK